MMSRKELGKVLRDLRTRSGLEQTDLARKADVSLVTVNLAETGERGLHDKCLQKIAEALGVPASLLKLLSDDSRDFDVDLLRKSALKVLYKKVDLLKEKNKPNAMK